MHCNSIVLFFCDFPHCTPFGTVVCYLWKMFLSDVPVRENTQATTGQSWLSEAEIKGKKYQIYEGRNTLHQALLVNLILLAFIRCWLSDVVSCLCNNVSGCVWFKENRDFILICGSWGDSQIGQVKCSSRALNASTIYLWSISVDRSINSRVSRVWWSEK